jgi:hypothetical protein
VAPPLCPPFFLQRGYPTSAKLVVGRPASLYRGDYPAARRSEENRIRYETTNVNSR